MAVRTLIRWTGDNPDREGLIDTPARVCRAYEQWFAGYDEDPAELTRGFPSFRTMGSCNAHFRRLPGMTR